MFSDVLGLCNGGINRGSTNAGAVELGEPGVERSALGNCPTN